MLAAPDFKRIGLNAEIGSSFLGVELLLGNHGCILLSRDCPHEAAFEGRIPALKEKKIPGAVPEKGKNLRVLSKLEDFLFIELSQMIKKWRVV